MRSIMPYAINHNGKAYGPFGEIKDVEGTPLKPKDTDAYNKALEAKELDYLRTGPDKCFLYIQQPDKECTQHTASGNENKGNMYFGVCTWLGTRLGNAWVGNRAYSGFQGHFRAYRRSVTVRIFGTLYHGWWFESSGDYVRLKKAKRQDTVYAATHRNGN